MSAKERLKDTRASVREARAVKKDDVDAVVLCAMGAELAPFVDQVTDPVELDAPGGARALRAQVSGHDLLLVRTGVGLVAAAVATTWALGTHAPRRVVSAGSAGGLGTQVEVGDVIISTELAYGQADATAFDYELGQVPGQPVRFLADAALAAAAQAVCAELGLAARSGLVLSSDSFVTARNVDLMREQFPAALSTDMESTAIAQVCHTLEVPMVSVRAISDLCGPRADQDFHLEVDHVAALSASAVLAMLAA